MSNRTSRSILLLSLSALLIAFACDSNSGGDPSDNFDRREMLRNYADNLIRPAYADLQTKTVALKTTWTTFDANPTADNLNNLKEAWMEGYSSWQFANAYNFGPAGEDGLRKGLVEEIGTFPANRDKIEEFIAAGDLSLNNFNRDTRGFLAIEYLIFNEENGSLLSVAERRAYLNAIVNHLQSRVDEVVTAWSSYTAEFLEANGTEAGSSTSLLYNEFVRSFESIKNFKVGLPAGKRPGQTQPEPELVEAYYSGKSLEMLKLHLEAIEETYYGRARVGQDGIGLKDYLDKVVGGPDLVVSTEAQLQKVKDALAVVPTDQPFSALVQNNHPSVDALHTELQKHTRFFKSDMSSLLGIAITFSSGDGD